MKKITKFNCNYKGSIVITHSKGLDGKEFFYQHLVSTMSGDTYNLINIHTGDRYYMNPISYDMECNDHYFVAPSLKEYLEGLVEDVEIVGYKDVYIEEVIDTADNNYEAQIKILKYESKYSTVTWREV
jgi:hypothetical protein